MKQLYLLSLIFIHISCFKSTHKTIFATVYDKDLSIAEVFKNMPESISDTDSFIEIYVNKWIKNELLLHNAEINLSDDLKNHKKQIEEYRESLLIYAYQQELINQNFDTTVADKEIKKYYNIYKDEFKLTKNIFKGRFIILDKNAPKQKRMKEIFTSSNNEHQRDLLEYCQQFALEYYLHDSIWQYFSTINIQLPVLIDKEDKFLRSTKMKQFDDSQYNYFIFIKDFQIKGSISPLDFEYEKIRSLLLNKNKLKYLKKIEDDLYQNALNSQKIKIYQ